MDDINQRMAKGAAWMVLFKLVDRSVGLVSIVILARILVPDDFGIVFMATSVIAMLELMNAFGFDIVLIQKPHPETRHFNTVWTLNVLFGLAISGLLVLVAPVAAAYYEEPRLIGVMYVLCIGTLADGIENIGIIMFRKDLQFDREFRFRLAKRLSAFAITVPLALYFRSYWALVAGIVFSRVFASGLSYVVHPYRPAFSVAARSEIFGFSKWLLLNNLFGFLRLKSADFVVGRFSGPFGLGLFSTAYEISNLPTTELVAPINRAVFPGYAKLGEDLHRLRQGYLDVLGIIALIALPAGAGLAACSQLVVDLLLGPKWHAAGPIVAILAFVGSTNALLGNTGALCYALARPKPITILSGIRVAVLLPCLIVFTHRYGVLGAAWTYLVVSLLFMPLTYGVAFRVIQVRARAYAAVVYRPVAATALMYLAVRMFLQRSGPSEHVREDAMSLALAIVLGVVVYAGGIALAWRSKGRPPGAESYVLERVVPKVRSFLNRAKHAN